MEATRDPARTMAADEVPDLGAELDRIVKYKRGRREERARGLRRLRKLMLEHLPELDPPFAPRLPGVPAIGDLKPTEDRIDAVLCAYVAAYWWRWGTKRNRVYGNGESGSIVVPQPPTS